MKHQFEEFKKNLSRLGKEPKIPLATITKWGGLNLNTCFTDTFVKEKKWSIFHYDKANNLIGLQFMDESQPNAYRVRAYETKRKGRNGRTSHTISVAGFLGFHNLRDQHRKVSKAYEARLSKDGKLVVIDLNKEWEFNEE